MMVYQGTGLSPLAIVTSSRQKLDLTKAGFISAKSVNGSLIKLAFWVDLIVDTIKFELRIPDRK